MSTGGNMSNRPLITDEQRLDWLAYHPSVALDIFSRLKEIDYLREDIDDLMIDYGDRDDL